MYDVTYLLLIVYMYVRIYTIANIIFDIEKKCETYSSNYYLFLKKNNIIIY